MRSPHHARLRQIRLRKGRREPILLVRHGPSFGRNSIPDGVSYHRNFAKNENAARPESSAMILSEKRSSNSRVTSAHAALIIFFSFLLSPAAAQAAQSANLCSPDVLPREIRKLLKTDYASWSVQTPETLGPTGRKSWQSSARSSCPGIAVGFFTGMEFHAYAILLVPSNRHVAGYRFVVFCRKPDRIGYTYTVVESFDGSAGSNCFIRSVKTSAFFDTASEARFHPQTADAVLMVDSAVNEYEADLYFWSNDRFECQPVDD